MIRADALASLPVRTALPALTRALDEHGAAVLCAPPGTGKTTLVPLVLAERGARVVVAEPRRIAARAAARRMAWLLGEKVGGRVGFTVRGERVVGRGTVVEVVTTGVLLQRLQRDQELAGADVVMLDECHERHLDADTVAAFVLDVRAALRPELRLLAASATTDAQGWARLLGDAPVVEAEGVAHPVEVVWAPPARPVRPPHGERSEMGVPRPKAPGEGRSGAADPCGLGDTAGAGRARGRRPVFPARRRRDRPGGGSAGGCGRGGAPGPRAGADGGAGRGAGGFLGGTQGGADHLGRGVEPDGAGRTGRCGRGPRARAAHRSRAA